MEIKKAKFLFLFKHSHAFHLPHWIYENLDLFSLQCYLFSLCSGKWSTPSNLVSFVGVPWAAAFLDDAVVVSTMVSFFFCSYHKNDSHFSLKHFQRQRFVELKSFAVVQKSCVWQSNKTCVSPYVDIPYMIFHVWHVERAHHIAPCACYKFSRYKIVLPWCIVAPFYQSTS